MADDQRHAQNAQSAQSAQSAKDAREAADAMPSPEEAVAAFAPARSPLLERPRNMLREWSARPPQLIHLEGGENAERVALALWWAALLNCEAGAPCLACPSCLRIGAGLAPDLIVLDGRQGSIKIDDVRALRPLLGEPPRFGRSRVIVMAEAQALGVEAANSLLKALEDPCRDTCFVFTVPQRERLLPTLVSRGWVVTLPWPDPGRDMPQAVREWEEALAAFLSTGKGWFEHTSVKGAVDAHMAQQVVLAAQKALAAALGGRAAGPLARLWQGRDSQFLTSADDVLARCHEALQAQVNPAYVLDCLASWLHTLLRAQAHERGARKA